VIAASDLINGAESVPGSFQQLEVRAKYIPGYEVQNFSTTRDGIRRNGTQSSGVSDSKAIVLFTDSGEKKETMANITKVILVAAIAAVSIASPALAQYASQKEAISARHSGRVRISSHQSALRAFASGPRSVDDPALTGGGSVGYNENLRLNRW
jgi:hypothetical protein